MRRIAYLVPIHKGNDSVEGLVTHILNRPEIEKLVPQLGLDDRREAENETRARGGIALSESRQKLGIKYGLLLRGYKRVGPSQAGSDRSRSPVYTTQCREDSILRSFSYHAFLLLRRL